MTMKNIRWVDDSEFNAAYGTEHFLVTGASGSGKTTVINRVLADVAKPSFGSRLLVYDAKTELLPLLYCLREVQEKQVWGGTSKIHVLNPLDARCSAWKISKDIDNIISARQLATTLVGEGDGGEHDSAAFFNAATVDILTGVEMCFIECAPNASAWTFRDVILTMLNPPYLRFILSQDTTRDGRNFPLLYRIRETYFGEGADSRTVGNIRASISTRLSDFEPIAAAWAKAAPQLDSPAQFSLTDWIESTDEILVFGNDESARTALDPLNRLLFKRATELLLAREEQTPAQKRAAENQTWVFLDEVREAGKLDGLGRFLTKGRSKGICVFLAFQDIDGLRDVYGTEVANEICAQCNNVAVLRLNSPSTASWASDLFGRGLMEARSRSLGFHPEGGGGIGLDRGVAEEERPFLHTDAFLYQKTPAQTGAVQGFVRGPNSDPTNKSAAVFRKELEFRVTDEVKTPPVQEAWQKPFSPRPPQDYLLDPWTQSDLDRLGFKVKLADLFINRQEARAYGAEPRLPSVLRGVR